MTRSIVPRIGAALVVVLAAGVALVTTGTSATATQGQPVIAGQTNTATDETVVQNTNFTVSCPASTNDGLLGCGATGVTGRGVGFGVYGIGNTGVRGDGGGVGARGVTGVASGTFSYGVLGSGETGVFGTGGVNGVMGQTSDNLASGVYGENLAGGYGVAGRAADGTGVLADSANGTALRVSGRSRFSTAGTAVVAPGQKSVTVSLAGVSATDFVLATVQRAGVFYAKNALAGSGQFTIYLNKVAPPAGVKVAYFVISAL